MPYRPTGRPNGRPRKTVPPPDGAKPTLSTRQWWALREETKPFSEEVSPPLGFAAESRLVAGVAGVSQRTVQRWRHDELYARGFRWLLRDCIATLQHLHSKRPWWSWDEQLHLEIHAWIADHWRGPRRSPLDGRLYMNSEDYSTHVIKHKAFHPEWQRSW